MRQPSSCLTLLMWTLVILLLLHLYQLSFLQLLSGLKINLCFPNFFLMTQVVYFKIFQVRHLFLYFLLKRSFFYFVTYQIKIYRGNAYNFWIEWPKLKYLYLSLHHLPIPQPSQKLLWQAESSPQLAFRCHCLSDWFSLEYPWVNYFSLIQLPYFENVDESTRVYFLLS